MAVRSGQEKSADGHDSFVMIAELRGCGLIKEFWEMEWCLATYVIASYGIDLN